MIHLLGPRITNEPPTEIHRNTPFEQPPLLERSSSSSSSSSDSIVEIQPPKLYKSFHHRSFSLYSFSRIIQPIARSQSEPPIETGNKKNISNFIFY